jgi:hypothetical protein
VVEREVRLSEPLSAILAFVFVPQKDVSAVELHDVPRHAVVADQTNDSRNLHLKIDRLNPFVVGVMLPRVRLSECSFDPLRKIVGSKNILLDRNDLG